MKVGEVLGGTGCPAGGERGPVSGRRWWEYSG